MTTTRPTKRPGQSHSPTPRERLIRRLANGRGDAVAYLDGCLRKGGAAFRLGLRDVIAARGGMTALSRTTGLNREALYRATSLRGNPRLDTLEKVLGALGMGLSVGERSSQGRKRKAAGGR